MANTINLGTIPCTFNLAKGTLPEDEEYKVHAILDCNDLDIETAKARIKSSCVIALQRIRNSKNLAGIREVKDNFTAIFLAATPDEQEKMLFELNAKAERVREQQEIREQNEKE
jgi:hypothetical protein